MKTHQHQEPSIPQKIEKHHLLSSLKQKKHKSHIAHFHILFEMMLKHYKLLFQSKISLLTMILGPLFMILLIGFAFNTSETQSISVSVYSENYSSVAENMISILNDDFNIQKSDSLDGCKGAIGQGNANACILFPENLDPTIEGQDNEVTIFADFSQMNLVYIILNLLNKGVGIQSEELSTKYAQDLLNTVGLTESEVNNNLKILFDADKGTKNLTRNIGKVDSLLSDVPTDFIVPSSQELDLTGKITLVEQYANSLASMVHNLISLSDLLAADKSSSLTELESAEETFESDCLNGTTADDCDEQELYVNYLKFYISVVEDYEKYIDSESLDSQIISLKLGVDSLKPQANLLADKLRDASLRLETTKQLIDNSTNYLEESSKSTSYINNQVKDLQGSNSVIQDAINTLTVTNANNIANPVKTKVEEITNSNKSHIANLFPNLLALFVMLISILLSSTFVIIEKKSSAFIRNNIAPVFSYLFPLSSLIVLLSILFIETIVLIVIAEIFFSMTLLSVSGVLIFAILLSSLVFIFLGMAIGFIFDNEESISLASIFSASIMMLFSSFIFPIQNMSPMLAKITLFNPFVITSKLFHKIIIFKAGFVVYATEIYGLLIALLIVVLIFIMGYKLAIRNA